MKKDNRALKRKMTIMYFAILCLSFTQKYLFVEYGNKTKNFYFFDLMIVLVTFVLAIFYLKTELKGERKRNNEFALLTLISYVCFAIYVGSRFVLFDSLGGQSIVSIGLVHFKLGFYIYWSSFILLFINTFLIELPYVKKMASSNKMIENVVDLSDQYLFCYYNSGLGGKFSSLKNTFSILVIKENSKKIGYCISADYSIKDKILEDKLINIEVEQVSRDLPTYLSEEEKVSAVSFLFKNMGPFIASDELLKTIDDYGAMKCTNVYEIKIKYLNSKNEKHEIVFLAKDSPAEMLKNINCEKIML